MKTLYGVINIACTINLITTERSRNDSQKYQMHNIS